MRQLTKQQIEKRAVNIDQLKADGLPFKLEKLGSKDMIKIPLTNGLMLRYCPIGNYVRYGNNSINIKKSVSAFMRANKLELK